jgi:NAD+ synthase (glutamine-hydrolysing)
MPAIFLAMAQINPTVGDFEGNIEKILHQVSLAHKQGAKLVLFPELSLTGYPIEDLALSADFLSQSEQALNNLAVALSEAGYADTRVVVGHPGFAKTATSWAIGQNKASLIFDGKVQQSYAKHHLPNYSVFDEYRVFVQGSDLMSFEIDGLIFSVVICEDIWQEGGPVGKISAAKTDVTLVLNGSPFEISKTDSRLQLVQKLAKDQDTAVAYVNLVGGQDDLVFDGNSFFVDSSGKEILRGKQFEDDLLFLEVKSKSEIHSVSNSAAGLSQLAQVWQALVLGTRDYLNKNGFNSVVLGLSGGIDSAVCAAIAVDAIGSENVHGIAMPSKFSSGDSIKDAQELASNIGLNFYLEPIAEYVLAFESRLKLEGLAQENLQARVRAVILMGYSNSGGQLLLTTGNKTELAVGYSTIYGDSAGGFAPIKDVEKTLVWELARYRNQLAISRSETPPIPVSSIEKPPSAELREDQTDQDSLPEYFVLDGILREYIENRRSLAEIVAAGFDQQTVSMVISLVKKSEWKRRQGAIGPRITKLAFGRERRFPISNEF